MKFTTLALCATSVVALPFKWNLFSQTTFGMGILGLDRPIPGDSPVMVCDLAVPKLVEIYELDVSPNPPEKGKNVTINAEGIVKKVIEEGAYVDVEVRYGYIKLLTQTFDLCEQAASVNLTCPLEVGKHVVNSTAAIPIEVPPGKYTVSARAYTVDDEPITCLDATVLFQ